MPSFVAPCETAIAPEPVRLTGSGRWLLPAASRCRRAGPPCGTSRTRARSVVVLIEVMTPFVASSPVARTPADEPNPAPRQTANRAFPVLARTSRSADHRSDQRGAGRRASARRRSAGPDLAQPRLVKPDVAGWQPVEPGPSRSGRVGPGRSGRAWSVGSGRAWSVGSGRARLVGPGPGWSGRVWLVGPGPGRSSRVSLWRPFGQAGPGRVSDVAGSQSVKPDLVGRAGSRSMPVGRANPS